jgi:hypothetical protein
MIIYKAKNIVNSKGYVGQTISLSQTEASKRYGVSATAIANAVKGVTNTSAGFHWKIHSTSLLEKSITNIEVIN